jgi:hypothetical protein
VISSTEGFAKPYGEVLVRFTLKPGTLAALEQAGVSDGTPNIVGKYPDMPLAPMGWKAKNVLFKTETLRAPGGGTKQVNIGLGSGPGLDIFNGGIAVFDVVGGAP